MRSRTRELVPKSKVHLCRDRKIYLNVTDNSLNEFEMQIAQDGVRSVSNAVN